MNEKQTKEKETSRRIPSEQYSKICISHESWEWEGSVNQIWKIIIKNEINLFFWRHFLKFSLERFRTVCTLNLLLWVLLG